MKCNFLYMHLHLALCLSSICVCVYLVGTSVVQQNDHVVPCQTVVGF